MAINDSKSDFLNFKLLLGFQLDLQGCEKIFDFQ